MYYKKSIFLSLPIALLLLSSSSCISDRQQNFPESNMVTAPAPAVLTELPVVTFQGVGIKYEFESMLLNHFVVFPDETASGQYAARLLDESSTAQVKVKFPAGTYECLVCEKTFDNDHAPFYIYVDNTPYRVYPSDPPLGSCFWELVFSGSEG